MNSEEGATVSRKEFYGNLALIGVILIFIQVRTAGTWSGITGPIVLAATSFFVLMWSVLSHRSSSVTEKS